MATYDASQPGEIGPVAGNYITDQEEQARKRTAIGLSPASTAPRRLCAASARPGKRICWVGVDGQP